MKLYFISGETSGDQHAAAIMRNLSKKGSFTFRGIGGPESASAGMEILIHQKELAFMGFLEVVKNLNIIRKSIKTVKKDLRAWKPEKLILIDYPGFNLRIAAYAKKLGIPVHYYIAPKVWAWNEKRIKKIRSNVDALYCILPFEETYFRKAGVNASYVGNPSWEKVRNAEGKQEREQDLIALLPGSRKQEIRSILPVMISSIRSTGKYRYAVSKAPGLTEDFYLALDKELIFEDNMYALLQKSRAALVTSGTATLETALLNVPQVVCYRTSTLSYTLAKWLIKLPYISLVNIILNKPAVCELIQKDLNPPRLREELLRILQQTEAIEEMQNDYESLRQRLGALNPSEEVSKHILES